MKTKSFAAGWNAWTTYSTPCALCSCAHEEKARKTRLEEKGCLQTVFEIQPYTATDSAAGCNVLLRVENSCYDGAWSVCMWEWARGCVCMAHTWAREGKGGGWSEGAGLSSKQLVRDWLAEKLPLWDHSPHNSFHPHGGLHVKRATLPTLNS